MRTRFKINSHCVLDTSKIRSGLRLTMDVALVVLAIVSLVLFVPNECSKQSSPVSYDMVRKEHDRNINLVSGFGCYKPVNMSIKIQDVIGDMWDTLSMSTIENGLIPGNEIVVPVCRGAGACRDKKCTCQPSSDSESVYGSFVFRVANYENYFLRITNVEIPKTCQCVKEDSREPSKQPSVEVIQVKMGETSTWEPASEDLIRGP